MKNKRFRMIRRLLPAALTMVMTTSAVFADGSVTVQSPGFSNFSRKQDYTVGLFSDVTSGDWFSSSVQTVYELGLMSGKSSVSFAPKDPVKLCEAISMAVKTHSIYNGGDGSLPQSEDPSAPWYTPAVNYAIQNQIILRGEFSDYEANATRAQLAYIFSGSVPGKTLAPINAVSAVPDVTEKTPYANTILLLYRAGVISGRDDSGSYDPDQTITRAEAASILCRIAQPSLRSSFAFAEGETSIGDAEQDHDQNDVGQDSEWNSQQEPDQDGNAEESSSTGPAVYAGTSESFQLLIPAETAIFWTASASDSGSGGKRMPGNPEQGSRQPDPEADLSLSRWNQPVSSASSDGGRKLPGQKTEADTAAVTGSVMGILSSRSQAAAPVKIFHNLTVRSLAEELEGEDVAGPVSLALKDGSAAYISPLYTSGEENAWYWILTTECGDSYLTLVGRAYRGEDFQVFSDVLTVMKSVEFPEKIISEQETLL